MPSFSYTISRSKRRRRTVALLVEPGGGVRVMAPMGLSLKKIERFVQERTSWIWHRLHLLQSHSVSSKPVCDFSDGAKVFFRGSPYRLRVCAQGKPFGCFLDGEALVVNLPEGGLSLASQQEETKLELSLWYKKQARRVFQERLGFWAERLGVGYKRLVVSSASKRWGSCNARGDIRLNWRLIMTPPDLLDYVAVHELCHIRYKNHAAVFWRFVASVMPDYKERRKRLRSWEPAGW